jgi:putative nucleotidyltransferase with HDIG domain
MDMVKAGVAVAIINVIAAGAILMSRTSYLVFQPIILFWAAINGIASGMLVLGITPILENMLHCATTFKLIELLDLSAPLMRQLAQKTPGTFSHSMLVANLAEAACQEIGARALLARAGAYYHDIGKIDQPEYFVENQHNDNKHDDLMNPRLSATVIRSHVKVGIEKGRAIGLPNEVIDIIATHHGNSLIS